MSGLRDCALFHYPEPLLSVSDKKLDTKNERQRYMKSNTWVRIAEREKRQHKNSSFAHSL